MVFQEAIIAYDTAINEETDSLEVLSPTSLRTRTGYGKPKLTHFMAFSSTDDVSRVYAVPSGYADSNGIDAPLIVKYSATTGFNLADAKLAQPVEIPENTEISIYATSETAADSVVYAWLLLEYPGAGKFVNKPGSGAMIWRQWEHGAALVSNTAADSTDINTLQPGRKYWIAAIGGAEVNGATAGIVGPAFIKFKNAEFEGAEFWIPLVNSSVYTNAPGMVDFAKVGLKCPVIAGGVPFKTACIGYTAEQPQAKIEFLVDKAFP